MSKKTTVELLKVESILLADQVIEAKDNKKSIIGIFNQIFVEEFPSVHPALTLFVGFIGHSKQDQEVQLRIVSPSGKVKFEKNFKITLSENGRSDLLMTFNSLPLEEPGEYDFILLNQDQTIASYQLLVVKLRKASDVIN